jgi:pilus assembly protein Flp/PilA
MNTIIEALHAFAEEEDGAQVIEYALIIAVVSIALIVLLAQLSGTNFSTFISRVGDCLSNTGTCS